MDAKSARRQLQAQVTVPVDASTVTSLVLTATGSAAHLPKDPVAAASVAIIAAAVSPVPAPLPSTAPLAVASLPDIPTASPALSPGGNAAGLFPTLRPSPAASPSVSPSGKPGTGARTRPVANTSALPESSPVIGGQLVGLGALALAFILAVTRLSIRRRPAPAQPVPADPEAAKPEPEALKPETGAPAGNPDET